VRNSIDCTWLEWRARLDSLSVVITQLAPSPLLLPVLSPTSVPVMRRAERLRLMARSSEELKRGERESIRAPGANSQ
jgi:hypothetical protein